MIEVPAEFMRLMDMMILLKEERDVDLNYAIKYIDEHSRKTGISFYEAAYMILEKHRTEKKAKVWKSWTKRDDSR